MRLIDADALDIVLRNEAKPFGHDIYDCGITDGLALARECVETAPTIDAVPVVRCRECRYGYTEDDGYMMCDNSEGYDHVEPNGFCAWGKRREDGDA